MAKGKHGAAAAKRRLAEAEERIRELERQVEEERSTAHERERELLEEVQNLKNRLVREVDGLAGAKIDELKRTHQQEVVDLHEEYNRRIYTVLTTIGFGLTEKIALNADLWNTLTDASKMSVAEVLRALDPKRERVQNRTVRRARKNDINKLFKANSSG